MESICRSLHIIHSILSIQSTPSHRCSFFVRGPKRELKRLTTFLVSSSPPCCSSVLHSGQKMENSAIENESMSNCIITSINVFGKILTHTYDGVDSNNLLKDQNILTTTAIFSTLFWKARLKKSDISV